MPFCSSTFPPLPTPWIAFARPLSLFILANYPCSARLYLRRPLSAAAYLLVICGTLESRNSVPDGGLVRISPRFRGNRSCRNGDFFVPSPGHCLSATHEGSSRREFKLSAFYRFINGGCNFGLDGSFYSSASNGYSWRVLLIG